MRNPHINTILASTAPRRWWLARQTRALRDARSETILECSEGVRLHGEYLAHPGARTLITLVHGWEGCAGSSYMLSASRALFRDGYSVFTLHLRDHGPSHHLNRDPFLAIRLTEVVDAVEAIQRRFPYARHLLVGFSLGGNIALRVAANAGGRAISLDQVIAICPPVDPGATAHAISASRIYNRHFVANWRRSFRRKLVYFPELRQHEDVFRHDDIVDLHEAFVPRFSDHPDSASYFRAYTLDGRVLPRLCCPGHILLTEDDPVIPAATRHLLPPLPELSVELSPYGGHCGFLQDYRLRSWLDQRLLELIG